MCMQIYQNLNGKFVLLHSPLNVSSMIIDYAPVLVLWFFDSRGEYGLGSWSFERWSIIFLGGMSPNPNSKPLPDWVDATVADWIQIESKAMENAWGPHESRAAVAFEHIPPSATHLLDIFASLMSFMLPLFLQTCYSSTSIQS